MTTAGPWSVKGIDPKAREIAKDLARRSGLTLGEWLNQMITDEGEEAPTAQAEPQPARTRAEPPRAASWREPPPAAPAAPAPVLSADSFRSRLREAGRGGGAEEIARVTRALSELTAKIEAAEARSTQAISGIDQQALGVISRLEGVERGQSAVGSRLDGALTEVRDVQDRLAERLRGLESMDGPRVEAMRALEDALGKVAAQIYEGESRTRAQGAEMREDITALCRRVDRAEASIPPPVDTSPLDTALQQLSARMDEAQGRTDAAVKALESSFASLDQRLSQTEGAGFDAEVGRRRFERLAVDLTDKVETARAEMASRLRDAADGRLDRMEAALRDLSGQIAETEKRSAGAIDRMGREVVRIAQGLDGRVGEVERQARDASSHLEANMARIADAMESRLSRADSVQAEALTRLGSEIERIAERLSDRIAASERRGASELTRGLDDVGDKLGRATDKLNSRYDHAAADIAERIRASEERTASLLQEARERIAGPATGRPDPIHVNADPHPSEAALDPASAFRMDEAEDEHGEADAPMAVAAQIDRFEQAFEPGPFGRPSFPDETELFADRTDPFTRAPGGLEAVDDDGFAPAAQEPAPAAAARPSSTRELIENARAVARANAEARGRRPSRTVRADEAGELFSTPAPGFDDEDADEAPVRKGLGMSMFGARPRRREASSTLKTALGASGVAAVISLGLGATSVAVLSGGGRGSATTAESPSAAPPLVADAATPAPTVLAVAETPAATAETAQPAAGAPAAPLKPEAAVVSPAADTPSARALYNQAVQGLERGDAGAVETLKRAANLGYAPAQFHLGKVFEEGLNGARKDAAEARRWTERAARAGDAKAMFNLGIYLANGDGGARDDKAALDWFRRAADGGMKDAQYNLAVMNQNGRGAPASPAEAYKWFLIAAADGDGGARASAEAIKKSLAPEAQATAERSAAAYRAQIAATAAASQVRTASR